MPRPTHQSRTPCAILSLSCAAATLILPTAAKADVSIIETFQNTSYSYQHFGDPIIEEQGNNSSDAFGWFSHSADMGDTFGTGNQRTTISTQYASVLSASPLPSGTINISRELTIGTPVGSDNYTVLVQSYLLTRVNVTTPTTFTVDATFTSPLSRYGEYGTPALISIYDGGTSFFRWSASGGLDQPSGVSASILLEPGPYTLFIHSSNIIFRFDDEESAPDISINFDASFAFVPAPSTCLPLMTASVCALFRRRR
jgi:hypothetical protein